MKNTIKVSCFALALVLGFSTVACSGSASGGKTFNSAEELKAYLDKQPAKGPDNPIKVTMAANAPMLEKIAATINSAGKYVSLSFSGSALTNIPASAFYKCDSLVAINIPDSVTSIGQDAFGKCTSLISLNIPNGIKSIGIRAFWDCPSLTSVKFECTLAINPGLNPFYPSGDLLAKYLEGGIGTYTTKNPGRNDSVWTKQ